ncbi:DUF2964 family protein [Trinickia sp. EG282A]|uniref:DUF2964 family protein n=1 Tax=Trinickia sp. EG282A TaxID=3237013 RepID=UPI0034D1F32F
MVQSRVRIALATISVFAVLAGLGMAIRGLVFDTDEAFHYGIGAIVVGVAAFVLLLNPSPRDDA